MQLPQQDWMHFGKMIQVRIVYTHSGGNKKKKFHWIILRCSQWMQWNNDEWLKICEKYVSILVRYSSCNSSYFTNIHKLFDFSFLGILVQLMACSEFILELCYIHCMILVFDLGKEIVTLPHLVSFLISFIYKSILQRL